MSRHQTLDQRISAALGGGKTSPDDLERLILEVNEAIKASTDLAKAEREHSLDPSTSQPDAQTASESAAIEELRRDRLKTALPRIEERLRGAIAAEHHDRWQAERNKVQALRDAAAKRFEKLPELFDEIINIFLEAEDVDLEVARVNQAAPDNVFERLVPTELHARGLSAFTFTVASLAKSTQLYAWATGDQIWPPRQPSIAATLFAAVPHRGGDWWQEIPEQQKRIAADGARIAAHNEQRERGREELKNAEYNEQRKRESRG